ncbi:MAG: hypothetical protein CL760_01410 [Chloroflexi bacterium]|nr:hypothetical protein [Chloroflexota bacterium]|tara:strand:- start:1800 stop:2420 length:621 start_codon:yes stop_codon:yes gene_type:complete
MIEEYIDLKKKINNNKEEMKISYLFKSKITRINLLFSTIFSFFMHFYIVYEWLLREKSIFLYLVVFFMGILVISIISGMIIDELDEIKNKKRKNLIILIIVNIGIPFLLIVSPFLTLMSVIFNIVRAKYLKNSEKRIKKLEIKNEKLKLKKLELWKKILNDKESLKTIEESKEIQKEIKEEYSKFKEEKSKLILEKAFKEKELIVE